MPKSTLAGWDKEFDGNMQPIVVPEKRVKQGKVTIDMVLAIINAAKYYKLKGRRIRLQNFTRMLAKENDIYLSAKTVGEILIANNLKSPSTRKKRPGYYQKLRQEIPNGLVSIDGSEMELKINDQIIKLNLEMSVDTNSFAHTAFSISERETSGEFIKVLKMHCRNWGPPLGVVCDSGSANLSLDSIKFLESHGILQVTAGPANPKGNGTIENAFSQLKEIVGPINIDSSSPLALAKSVLQVILSVYVKMRNKIPLMREAKSPLEGMGKSVSEKDCNYVKQKLQNHVDEKKSTGEDQCKRDLLHSLIKNLGIIADSDSIKRAEKTIIAYNIGAIYTSEEAFVKAVNRKKERLNLPYFFGILKRIQQDQDDLAYKQHCQKRYNYDQIKKHMNIEQEKRDSQKPATVEEILKMVLTAANASSRFIKELALRRVKEWVVEISKTTKYTGILRKKFQEELSTMPNIKSETREKMWAHIDGLLSQ